MRFHARLITGALGLLAALIPTASKTDEGALAALKAGGHVMIVRHGLTTPGTGDPRNFKLDECATQRNLVDEGREQSRRLGRLLRERGIEIERVLSSEWCRCKETATLIDAGKVETLPVLNNLVGRGEFLESQTRELRAAVASWRGKGTLLLVTHGSVVFPLAGTSPREAEGFVLKPAPGTAEGFVIVGKIGPSG
ncbi:MAG TPA: histidine phosphatase family protein [Xanthobacteraceae bacterium]|jgi:phosphohistidine phosphatase SixA